MVIPVGMYRAAALLWLACAAADLPSVSNATTATAAADLSSVSNATATERRRLASVRTARAPDRTNPRGTDRVRGMVHRSQYGDTPIRPGWKGSAKATPSYHQVGVRCDPGYRRKAGECTKVGSAAARPGAKPAAKPKYATTGRAADLFSAAAAAGVACPTAFTAEKCAQMKAVIHAGDTREMNMMEKYLKKKKVDTSPAAARARAAATTVKKATTGKGPTRSGK